MPAASSSSDTEIIFAVNERGEDAMSTSPLEISAEEREWLFALLQREDEGMMSAVLGGKMRVFRAFFFTPFGWYIAVSEEKSVFFSDAEKIRFQTAVTVLAAGLAAALLLIFFTRRLTRPVSHVVDSMNTIIDFSGRVEVEYDDETGVLAGTFNVMIAELEKLYKQIKRYAFEAVLAGKKELRIRQISQKYVPKDLIDKFFAAPEAMLVGDNRDITILFSDIRSFTTISESMAPDDLVHSLNRYFSGQVDIIMNRNGIVDKYIGDAIMAFWGAPVKHADDALQSILSGLDMIDALEGFNEHQRGIGKIGKPEFHIGIGINYGIVTVGNIGSERKMDYTVIGDAVNLASPMEGLTKTYRVGILISEFLYQEIEKSPHGLSVRLLDTVAVKGKTRGIKIYTVKRSLMPDEERAWPLHNEGMELSTAVLSGKPPQSSIRRWNYCPMILTRLIC
ncbi:MAG: adenylate/guanylate cyclase domain-containing protein [Treponema sp.]|jgi:class 3 adenylate cyclase/HAMP domain-containing protein|nr:adenylate/guanylate cyclase domain-containing protein [Treponema sp.]